MGGRAFGPPLCGGTPPATPPFKNQPRHRRTVLQLLSPVPRRLRRSAVEPWCACVHTKPRPARAGCRRTHAYLAPAGNLLADSRFTVARRPFLSFEDQLLTPSHPPVTGLRPIARAPVAIPPPTPRSRQSVSASRCCRRPAAAHTHRAGDLPGNQIGPGYRTVRISPRSQ